MGVGLLLWEAVPAFPHQAALCHLKGQEPRCHSCCPPCPLLLQLITVCAVPYLTARWACLGRAPDCGAKNTGVTEEGAGPPPPRPAPWPAEHLGAPCGGRAKGPHCSHALRKCLDKEQNGLPGTGRLWKASRRQHCAVQTAVCAVWTGLLRCLSRSPRATQSLWGGVATATQRPWQRPGARVVATCLLSEPEKSLLSSVAHRPM